MKRPALSLLTLFAALLWIGCGQPPPKQTATNNVPSTSAASTKTVQIVIDYGDGVRKTFAALPWHEKMTIRGVLDEAQSHSHGITYVARGKGEEAILTKLDDLENQLGEKAKDWLYYVNDRQGDKSFDAWEVRPGDVILWKFGVYE